MSAIDAKFDGTATIYVVGASDSDGDPLTYTWSKTDERDCGDFVFSGGEAFWVHPHAPCPAEPVHPGTIMVEVSDGHGHTVVAIYPFGSEAGTGPAPTDVTEPEDQVRDHTTVTVT